VCLWSCPMPIICKQRTCFHPICVFQEWADSRINDLIKKACEGDKPFADEVRIILRFTLGRGHEGTDKSDRWCIEEKTGTQRVHLHLGMCRIQRHDWCKESALSLRCPLELCTGHSTFEHPRWLIYSGSRQHPCTQCRSFVGVRYLVVWSAILILMQCVY
jgi:hypothetical protein